MSDLAKRLEAAAKPTTTGIDAWIAGMTPDESAAWTNLLVSATSIADITELVRGENVPVGRDRVRQLRKLARERAGIKA